MFWRAAGMGQSRTRAISRHHGFESLFTFGTTMYMVVSSQSSTRPVHAVSLSRAHGSLVCALLCSSLSSRNSLEGRTWMFHQTRGHSRRGKLLSAREVRRARDRRRRRCDHPTRRRRSPSAFCSPLASQTLPHLAVARLSFCLFFSCCCAISPPPSPKTILLGPPWLPLRKTQA